MSNQKLLTAEQQINLLHTLVEYAEWICDDEFIPGFSIYHIELPLNTELNSKLGIKISARITRTTSTKVEIRDWWYYNA